MILEPHIEQLLHQRYYQSNEDWPALVDRVVNYVCANDPILKKDATFFILNRIFLPNSPCLVNAGTKINGLFACFVVGPSEDSLEAHLETLADIAAVAKKGGGAGFTGTFIRPKGSPVAGSAHGYAYGPNNYASNISSYLAMMTQGGFRRMALMYTLRSDHADLDEFIDLKQNRPEADLSNFNQSIMATDEWMIKARTKETKENVQLHKIAQNAWNNGEPGLLFYDTINEQTPYTSCRCRLEATNPCGELPLPEWGSCNLGSINLSHDYFYDDNNFRLDRLEYATAVLTRFLDNVGSRNAFPNEKFANWYEQHRPIGVGVMGVADMFLRLGLRYGSPESLSYLSRIMETIYASAKLESEVLGIERGIPEHCKNLNRRNVTLLSIAPTGSISFIANCSSGIEPVYAPSYTRTDERGETYQLSHAFADQPHFVSALNDDPDKTPTWQQHIDIQAVAQKWVDSAVSKTVGAPNNATVEDIYNAFIYAYDQGCKGITVYRDGSRQKQVLTTKSNEQQIKEIVKNNAPKRPAKLPCKVFNTSVKGEYWIVLIGFLGSEPYEIFAYPNGRVNYKQGTITKHGRGIYSLEVDGEVVVENIPLQYQSDEQEALTRLISTALRHGADVKFVIEQLEKSNGTIVSFSKAVARALKSILKNGDKLRLTCDECGSENLIMQEGCWVCENGHSACS